MKNRVKVYITGFVVLFGVSAKFFAMDDMAMTQPVSRSLFLTKSDNFYDELEDLGDLDRLNISHPSVAYTMQEDLRDQYDSSSIVFNPVTQYSLSAALLLSASTAALPTNAPYVPMATPAPLLPKLTSNKSQPKDTQDFDAAFVRTPRKRKSIYKSLNVDAMQAAVYGEYNIPAPESAPAPSTQQKNKKRTHTVAQLSDDDASELKTKKPRVEQMEEKQIAEIKGALFEPIAPALEPMSDTKSTVSTKRDRKAYHKAWKDAHKDKQRAYKQVYRAANKERINAQERARRAAKKRSQG